VGDVAGLAAAPPKPVEGAGAAWSSVAVLGQGVQVVECELQLSPNPRANRNKTNPEAKHPDAASIPASKETAGYVDVNSQRRAGLGPGAEFSVKTKTGKTRANSEQPQWGKHGPNSIGHFLKRRKSAAALSTRHCGLQAKAAARALAPARPQMPDGRLYRASASAIRAYAIYFEQQAQSTTPVAL
jgi:hypothetical protein